MTAFTVEDIARVVHAANREIQVITGDPLPSAPWESTPEEIREVAMAGVRGALAGETPEESHATWCRNMAADGWRRGEFKDPAAKIHPCLVPYNELPEAQRVKDAVFTATVRAMSGQFDADRYRGVLQRIAHEEMWVLDEGLGGSYPEEHHVRAMLARRTLGLGACDCSDCVMSLGPVPDEDEQHARDMAAEDGDFDTCESTL